MVLCTIVAQIKDIKAITTTQNTICPVPMLGQRNHGKVATVK